jgi:hypothetical protein
MAITIYKCIKGCSAVGERDFTFMLISAGTTDYYTVDRLVVICVPWHKAKAVNLKFQK